MAIENKVLVLIPARFSSTRFPGKPLAMIKNKTMINRVYENALSSGFETYVVTDAEKIERHVLSFGGKVIRVDDDVVTGSERVALAFDRFFGQTDYELIINVQGDEPLVKGQILKKLAQFHLDTIDDDTNYDIVTLLKHRDFVSSEITHSEIIAVENEDFLNPNIVKAAFVPQSGRCLYFSRSPIPYFRERLDHWYQHIGIYSYKIHALKKFVQLPIGYLENFEKLEQLRALEHNMKIGAITTREHFVGVDVPEDIEKVETLL